VAEVRFAPVALGRALNNIWSLGTCFCIVS